MTTGRPEGENVMLDVAHLEALLAKTFNIGLDVGRGKEPVALVRLRLSKALLGAAEAQALAAESIALERGVPTDKIAEACRRKCRRGHTWSVAGGDNERFGRLKARLSRVCGRSERWVQPWRSR